MLKRKKLDTNLYVQSYDNELLVGFSNTIFSAINFIENILDIYLKKITTFLLGHKFGTVKLFENLN